MKGRYSFKNGDGIPPPSPKKTPLFSVVVTNGNNLSECWNWWVLVTLAKLGQIRGFVARRLTDQPKWFSKRLRKMLYSSRSYFTNCMYCYVSGPQPGGRIPL